MNIAKEQVTEYQDLIDNLISKTRLLLDFSSTPLLLDGFEDLTPQKQAELERIVEKLNSSAKILKKIKNILSSELKEITG